MIPGMIPIRMWFVYCYELHSITHTGQCMDLTPPTDATIDYDFEPLPMRPYGTTATYTCTSGTTETRNCNNGEWTGTAPMCQDVGMFGHLY